MRTFLTVAVGGTLGALSLFILRLTGFFSVVDGLVFQSLNAGKFPAIVSPDGSFVLGLLLAYVLAWIAADVPRASQRWLLGTLAMLLLGTGALVLGLYQVGFSPFAPILGAFSGLAWTSLLTRIGPGAFRRRVDEIFANSLSRRSLRTLYDGPAANLQSPVRHPAAVLALHISSNPMHHTSMSAESQAEMNRAYLSLAAEHLAEAGAFIESCGGQSIRAIFGLPIGCELPTAAACREAVELVHRLERLNLEADSRWHHILDFHVGVASGELLAGAFGSMRGLPYVATGPALEEATRLCLGAPVYGCRILLSMDAHGEVADSFEVRPIDLLTLPGGKPREIYELMAAKDQLSPERKRSRDHFWNGVTHTRAGRYDEALAEFTKARIKGLPDGALDYYLQRLETERSRGGLASIAG
jgi:class 3 adenylate cyclase